MSHIRQINRSFGLLVLVGIAALAIPAACHAQGYTITTVAGEGRWCSGYDDGGKATQATAACLGGPVGVAVNKTGNLFIADSGYCVIRKVTPAGAISTVAGTWESRGYSGDGNAATRAELKPSGIAVDAAGNLYIAERYNGRIRKLTSDGKINTVAGGGSIGITYVGGFPTITYGDGGPATQAYLSGPVGVAVDAAGNLLIADAGNYNVRKVATNGTISTVAGNGKMYNPSGGNGDGGPATSAYVIPSAVAVDAAGNLYIAEDKIFGNHDVRKVSVSGTISTYAGSASRSYSGDGGPATSAGMNSPEGVAVDSAGNVYIADTGDNRVRVVSTGGTITTIAGDGSVGYIGDGGPATSAEFYQPWALAMDSGGHIYVADAYNYVVRMLTPTASTVPPAISAGGIISAYAFGGSTAVAPGSWIEIYGTNLAADGRSWTGTDFSGNTAPTSLDGTSVTVGGQPAYIDYISPGQVNAQVPSGIGAGSQPVVVTASGVASPPLSITVNLEEPGLLAPTSFKINGTQYVVALFPDGATFVLPPGAISGVTSRRAKPGDVITLYGIGFGSVTPNIPAGQIVRQSNTLAAPFHILFGQTEATLQYDGLAPGAIGLYQFNRRGGAHCSRAGPGTAL